MSKMDLGRPNHRLPPILASWIVLVAIVGIGWGGPSLKMLSAAAFAGGVLLWVVDVLWQWKSRRPLRLRPYGELRHAERPVGYHLATFGLVFALAMFAVAVLVGTYH